MKRLIAIAMIVVASFSSAVFSAQNYGLVNDIYVPVSAGGNITVQLTTSSTWYTMYYNSITTNMVLATLLAAKTSGARVEVDTDASNTIITAVHILTP